MRQNADLLTASEVARRSGVTSETVRRWAREGKVEYLRLPSGGIRFPADQEILQRIPVQGATG